MQESTTYQAILEEGRLDGARKILIMLGTDQFGLPSDSVKQQLLEIADLKRLHAMVKAIRNTSSWEALLENP
jgi:hypothetical protein